MIKKICKVITVALLSASLITGCGQSKNDIPYTELNFDSTLEEVFALEGEEYETYYSLYEGTTYTYPKEYVGKSGKIKYMTDSEDKIQNIAWVFSGNDADEIAELNEIIHKDIEKRLGKPLNRQGVNNASEIWKLKTGSSVVLSTVTTTDANLLQIAYLSPEVSSAE